MTHSSIDQKVLTIDRIELQDSAHIWWLRADQLEDGDVSQTYITVATDKHERVSTYLKERDESQSR